MYHLTICCLGGEGSVNGFKAPPDDKIFTGKSAGFVTVSRVTDATPAALYANVADRKWEGESFTQNITWNCRDIAAQLIDDYDKLQVSWSLTRIKVKSSMQQSLGPSAFACSPDVGWAWGSVPS